MQAIDPSTPYFIRPVTQLSASVAADVSLRGILSVQGVEFEPLSFYITPSTHQLSRHKICTSGITAKVCLDQNGINVSEVLLQRPGYYSGQEWSLTGTLDPQGESLQWKMQSDFAGPKRFLAVDDDGRTLVMAPIASEEAPLWEFFAATSEAEPPSSTITGTTSSRATDIVTTTTKQRTTTTQSETTAPATSPTPSSGVGTSLSRHCPSMVIAGIIVGIAAFFGQAAASF